MTSLDNTLLYTTPPRDLPFPRPRYTCTPLMTRDTSVLNAKKTIGSYFVFCALDFWNSSNWVSAFKTVFVITNLADDV